MSRLLKVKIQSPEKITWQGEAQSVSTENLEGELDILPEHANFVTIIEKKPITIILKNKGQKIFEYEKALIYVEGNNVNIYTHLEEQTPGNL